MNRLQYAYYVYACIECTCFCSNISPHVIHVMTELGHWHHKVEKGSIPLTVHLGFNL